MVRLEWVNEVVADLDEAELVSVPGADAYPISGDIDPLIRQIARFLGCETSLTPERTVRAVLFTDVVDSTARASAEGDAAWRAILERSPEFVG